MARGSASHPAVLPVQADGLTGRVEFDGEAVVLHPDDLGGFDLLRPEPLRLRLADIGTVEWRSATANHRGILRFAPRRVAPHVAAVFDLDAALPPPEDARAVTFKPRQEAALAAVRDAVRAALRSPRAAA